MNIFSCLRIKLFLLLFLISGFTSAQAQSIKPDSICVVFRFFPEKDTFYVPFKGNGDKLNELFDVVDKYKDYIQKEKIPVRVTSYSAGLSTYGANMKSAKIRANRVKSELIVKNGLVEADFITKNYATSYEGLTSVVEVRIVIPKQIEEPEPQPEPEPIIGATIIEEPQPKIEEEPKVVAEVIVEEIQPIPTLSKSNKNTFNIRTNLLYWAALTPNLGIEYKPNAAVGILLNGAWIHWMWRDKQRQFRLFNINPEVRFYLGDRKQFYLGLEGHYGDVNFKLNDTGRQADFLGGGITIGYQIFLSKTFDMDFNIGLGYTHLSNYETYIRTEDNYVLTNKPKSKKLWGPTQAGVTLIWKLK